jgi:uncharacterized membrane protein
MEKIFISTKQLIISIIFFGGNSLLFISYLKELIFSKFHYLRYLTNLSYYANSIFLLLCLICDISLYINNNNSQQVEADYHLIDDDNKKNENYVLMIEQLNNWNRNKYGVICNTFSFFVSISFWILYFLGESYIKTSNNFYSFLSTINLHLIITVLVLIDIFMSKKEHQFSWSYFGIISLIFFIYCAITGINKYSFNSHPYAFMKGSLLFLIFYVMISFALLYFSYIIYVYLINYKKKENDSIKEE